MTDGLLLVSRRLPDHELILRVHQLARAESRLTALLVAHLAEFDDRRLYLGEGYSSLFAYCTEALHLSEQSTLNRIVAARLARQFPEVLKRLEDRSVHLAGLRVLSPVMTCENHVRLLDMARHQSRRRIEQLVANECNGEKDNAMSVIPKSTSPLMVGGLFDNSESGSDSDSTATESPAGSPQPDRVSGHEVGPGHPDSGRSCTRTEPEVTPYTSIRPSNSAFRSVRALRARTTRIAPGLIRLRVTLDAEGHSLLLQARELLLHRIPQGDLSLVIHYALDRLVKDLRRRKFGGDPHRRRKRKSDNQRIPIQDGSPRRYVPTEVRRAVWTRDEGRCAFIGADGHRCAERGRLEFHHVIAFARGGPATIENIQMRCRAHNQYEAEKEFGTSRRSESQDAGRP